MPVHPDFEHGHIQMAEARTPWWAWTWPALAWVVLIAAAVLGTGGLVATIAGIVLIATVFAAVYHAEVVAHRTGEPFGTLVLAVAVTVIETALIISVMLSAPAENVGLARDTVFAAVMIVCNGIVGACLLWGGARHREQGFQLQGASAALAVLAALTILTLVLPNAATSVPGPLFSTPQLVFVAIVSLALYGRSSSCRPCGTATISSPTATSRRTRHRLPTGPPSSAQGCSWWRSSRWSALPRRSPRLWSCRRCPPRRAERGCGGHHRGAGPAARGSRRRQGGARRPVADKLEPGVGIGVATIGLTIPVVAVVSIALRQPLELGLNAKDQVLLALTLLLSVITLGTGRTSVLQGMVHLLIFAVFLFFAVAP